MVCPMPVLPLRKPPRPASILLAICLLVPATGRSDESHVSSLITEVTVQLDRAQIVRQAEPVLTAGRQTLVFADLPVALDRSTVRLETTEAGIEIGRPTFREVETTHPVGPAARRLGETLDRLQRQRRIERDGIAVQQLILDVLRQSQISVEPGDLARLDDASSLFSLLETRSKEALQAIRAAEHSIDQLDAEIDRHQRELARLGDDPMRRLELSLPVTAEAAGPVALRLSYAVHGAGFTPSVQASLDVEAGTIDFVAMAEVSQRTGEDWTAIDLALSTATPDWQTAAPPTDTWYIDIRRDEPRPSARLEASSPMAMAPMAAMRDVAIDRGDFDVVYRLDEAQTIAADGTLQQVRIARESLPAELVWRSVPAVDERAWLTAAFDYVGTAPILPGPVFLYRDGQAIGQAHLGGLQPGEEVELGFGADPAIAIERRLLTDQRAQSGLIGTTRRHERRFATHATNRRPSPVTLEIVERLPVARDTRITVELGQGTTPPTTMEHDGDQGVLAWRIELEPEATRTVTFAYTIRHPADLDVTGF
jgi:uncharacterized protein (TIGR02231 family)